MAYELREVWYSQGARYSGQALLAGDIGGTNSNFGIFILQEDKPVLVLSLHAKSQQVTDFNALTAQIIDYLKTTYRITIERACFGVAGVVNTERTYSKPTNLAVPLDGAALKQATGINKFFLINDFEAVGFGLPWLGKDALVTISQGTPVKGAAAACIGAGTGLGKVMLWWHKQLQQYIPLASEGGHADCAVNTQEEFELLRFIQEQHKTELPVSWEQILSGLGIQTIYAFLGQKKQYPVTAISSEIAATGFKPDSISRYAQQDELCRLTFDWYVTFYARCAKNFALEALSLGGMYIAGGIAAKNIELFKKPAFMQEFIRCRKHALLLKNMPVYVIADYNVSLYGAAGFLLLQSQKIV